MLVGGQGFFVLGTNTCLPITADIHKRVWRTVPLRSSTTDKPETRPSMY